MKTKIAVLVGTLLAFVLNLNNVSAQTPTTPIPVVPYAVAAAKRGLPIQNLGVLKSALEADTKQGYLQIRHPGIIPNGVISIGTGVQENANAEFICGKLRSTRMSAGLSNTNGLATIDVALHNKNGHRTFEGSRTSLFQRNQNGIFWIQSSSVSVVMVKEPMISVPGLVSAQAVFYDNTCTNVIFRGSLNVVDGGYLMYSTNFLERCGEILLNFREQNGSESTVVVDTHTGASRPIENVSGYVGVGIEGDLYFGVNPRNTAWYGVDLKSIISRFEVQPLADGSIPCISVGGRSSSGEEPIGILFRAYPPATSDDPWTYAIYTIPPSCIVFPPGVHEMVYVFTPADLDGVPIQPWPVVGKGF